MISVAVYGLGAGPLAHFLGVAQPNPRGVLIIGASPWARALALALRQADVPVLVADTNRTNINEARMAGLRVYFGNLLSDHGRDQANLSGIGQLLALTPNDETNALASMHFQGTFDSANVFQLMPEGDEDVPRERLPKRLRGRRLIGPEGTYANIAQRFRRGAEFKVTKITDEFNFQMFKERYGDRALPIAIIDNDGRPQCMTATNPPKPESGNTVISLSFPVDEAAAE